MSLKPAHDARAADWIVKGLRGFAESVLSLVPTGFPAYVRIFHPAYRDAGTAATPVDWQEIAAANHTHAHPGMQLNALTGGYRFMNDAQPGIFDHPPRIGSLPHELVAQLAAVLSRHTLTPERCWFAIWNGFGAMPSDVRSAPTFSVPSREYYLLAGPVASAADDVGHPPLRQSPNLWWPDDHAWCVATEIDLNTTYIGCTNATRDAVLALPDVEALPIDPHSGVTWNSDLLNPF